jgi:hypothetical protein
MLVSNTGASPLKQPLYASKVESDVDTTSAKREKSRSSKNEAWLKRKLSLDTGVIVAGTHEVQNTTIRSVSTAMVLWSMNDERRVEERRFQEPSVRAQIEQGQAGEHEALASKSIQK